MNKQILFLLFVGLLLFTDLCQAKNIDNNNEQLNLQSNVQYNDEAACSRCEQKCKDKGGVICGRRNICCEPNRCIEGLCDSQLYVRC